MSEPVERRDNSAMFERFDHLDEELMRLEQRVSGLEIAASRDRGFVGGVVAACSTLTGIAVWLFDFYKR